MSESESVESWHFLPERRESLGVNFIVVGGVSSGFGVSSFPGGVCLVTGEGFGRSGSCGGLLVTSSSVAVGWYHSLHFCLVHCYCHQ